jgi:hypothetical protein
MGSFKKVNAVKNDSHYKTLNGRPDFNFQNRKNDERL